MGAGSTGSVKMEVGCFIHYKILHADSWGPMEGTQKQSICVDLEVSLLSDSYDLDPFKMGL